MRSKNSLNAVFILKAEISANVYIIYLIYLLGNVFILRFQTD